jgi:hypothetical protein
MRRAFRILALGAAAAAAGSGAALAQATSSQSTGGSATVFQPIALSKATDLSFGVVVRPSAGSGTVTVSTAGARTLSGNGALLTGAVDGTPTAATFTVGGEGGQAFSITAPASVAISSGANALTVALAQSASSGTLSGALGATGSATFSIGGSITVSSSTASGAYAGTFTTTVSYN